MSDKAQRQNWVGLAEMCRIVGVTASRFGKNWRPYLPDTACKKTGRNLYFDTVAVVKMIRTKDATSARSSIEQKIGDGTLSEVTLREKKAKAELLELKVASQKRNLVPREEIHTHMVRLAAIIKEASNTLQRQYGSDAWEIIDDAMVRFEKEMRRKLVAAIKEEKEGLNK